MNHVLALDLGTGSTRAVMFDSAGAQVAVALREWHHAPVDGAPGARDFDTATDWRLVAECIREVLGATPGGPASIACVTASSMREGMVLFDRSGTELWACPNIDGRARDEADELVRSGVAQELYRVGGDWVSITSAARFRWLARHAPALLGSAAAMGMLSDWAIRRLTGVLVTDPSCGSSSGLFDLGARTWSAHLTELVGVPADILPEVVETGTVIGAVTPLAAGETGLLAGTPVAVGGADTQLGLIGLDALGPDHLALLGGSFWQVTLTTDAPLIDPQARLRTLCHARPGTWMTEGIGFLSGYALRWFRDAFCDGEVEQARARGVDPYAVMEEAAAAVPIGSGGVIATFSNTMDARRWVQASPSFLQFDVDDAAVGRAACIRALQEQAAYVALTHVRILEELQGRRYDRIVFGGGAAQGRLWPRIVADVLGLEVLIPVVKESTALGAAMCAGVGVGLYPSLPEIADRAFVVQDRIVPDPASHDSYQRYLDRWRATYQRVLDLSEDGILRPMWWPAGSGPRRTSIEELPGARS